MGTGLLGAAFVEGLLARGERVSIWNRTRAKAEPLAARGAAVFDSPVQAVQSTNCVHLCLSDDAAVDATLEAILPSLAPRAWVIDHTTTSPRGTRARYERMAAAGVRFCHAPVFMSPANAREAKGLMLLSGPDEVVTAVRPLLSTMTGELMHVGPRVEAAAASKLFGNAVLVAIAGGLADVLTMARGLELDPEAALAIFSKFDVGAGVKIRGARMARGDFTASFELAMARKDVRLMLEASAGSPLSVLPALAARMDDLIARGHGHDDLGVLAIDALAPRSSASAVDAPDDGARGRVLDRLHACHRRIEEELAAFGDASSRLAAGEDAAAALEASLAFADRTILRHEEDEESSLFPRAVVVAGARPILARLAREHEEQRALWDRVRHAAPTSFGELPALARELATSYAAHMRVEEDELFPLLTPGLSEEDWNHIDQEMAARRGKGGGGGRGRRR